MEPRIKAKPHTKVYKALQNLVPHIATLTCFLCFSYKHAKLLTT